MTDRNEYMRNLMRKRRADNPTSQKGRMRKALEAVRDDLADTRTAKGHRLLAIVEGALK